ncbi:MAG: transposase, partial [Candidatus Oleimicrobiaceae bacterium]
MPYKPEKHHRRSIRLKGYNYTQAWAYFVTICTQNRECLFGEIVNGQMVLNDAGRMIQMVWGAIPEHYPGIKTDAFVIIPNYIHGIVVITTTNAPAPA